MSGDLVVGLLGGGGFAAIAAAIVTGLFSKRKLGAEATQIITNAATSVVTRLEAEVGRADASMDRLREDHEREMGELRRDFADERERWRRVLQLHVAWDAIAISKMADLGVELPPAPPLLPPTDYDRR